MHKILLNNRICYSQTVLGKLWRMFLAAAAVLLNLSVKRNLEEISSNAPYGTKCFLMKVVT